MWTQYFLWNWTEMTTCQPIILAFGSCMFNTPGFDYSRMILKLHDLMSFMISETWLWIMLWGWCARRKLLAIEWTWFIAQHSISSAYRAWNLMKASLKISGYNICGSGADICAQASTEMSLSLGVSWKAEPQLWWVVGQPPLPFLTCCVARTINSQAPRSRLIPWKKKKKKTDTLDAELDHEPCKAVNS